MEWFDNAFTQFKAMTPTRQIAFIFAAAVSIAAVGYGITQATAPEYRVLYRGLEADEAGRVADVLSAEGIDFEFGDGGTAVRVLATQVPEARISVARQGLPGGGGTGFEIFDEPAFGVTDFVHRVNYVRAVQGELGRSIEQLESVERARVQVVIPERKSVLDARERKPSASVVMRLRTGRSLDREQVQAVVHLVASSIEGLDPGDVTVVDGVGRLLAPLDDMGGGLAGVGGSSHQQRIEAELGKRIESIIEKTVGPGNVVARVNAELDWSESETTEEIYDPEGQIARSEQRSTELSNEGSAEGVAGAVSNLADGGGSAPAANGSSRTSETINYEISKKISRTVQPMGRIARLSVAVLVADKPGETPEDAPVPWDGEALSLFEGLAREASGLDIERGDRITVRSAPFRTIDPELGDPPSFWPQWSPLLVAIARGAMALAALFVFAQLILRPLLGALPSQTDAELPVRLAELEARIAAGGTGAETALNQELASSAGGEDGQAISMDDGLRALRTLLNQG